MNSKDSTFNLDKNRTHTDYIEQLKNKEIKDLRENLIEHQSGVCKLCAKEITEETGVSLDHQHKRKSEINGVDGAGLVRGVLCRSCNVWEGKIWNNTGRYRQPKNVKDRIDFLNGLLEYYKSGTLAYIHPSEKPSEPTVSKRNYNRLKKVYELEKRRKRFPEYPKSKKLTKGLQELFKEFNISPWN